MRSFLSSCLLCFLADILYSMYVFGGLGLDDKGVVLLNDVWRWNFSTYMKR